MRRRLFLLLPFLGLFARKASTATPFTGVELYEDPTVQVTVRKRISPSLWECDARHRMPLSHALEMAYMHRTVRDESEKVEITISI